MPLSNAASSDDRPAIDALLNALAGSGKALLHTSSSSIVADNARGEASEAMYDEEHLPTPAPDKTARVALDHAILSASEIRSLVLCNALVFGDALGPQAHRVQLPLLIDRSPKTGTANYIGRGLNRWSTIHITDVVGLYLLALDRAPMRTFAFAASGVASFRNMAQSIADGLHLGEPISLMIGTAVGRWGEVRARYSLASNSCIRSLRTRALVWSPTGPTVHQWIRGYLKMG